MNPIQNPFSPGAGTPPPELAGRGQILESASLALERARIGRSARSQMLLGLRGVGKTVLLNRIAETAEKAHFLSVVLEAPEERPLAEMIIPPLRSMLFKLRRSEKAMASAKRALAVLRSFASAFKFKVGEIEFGVEAEVGVGDSGALDVDLPEVFLSVAVAAQQAGTAIAVLLDEVQYLSATDLGALITAVHRVSQRSLPFVLFGAGLPQLAGLAGEAKSYAERLFDYPNIGPLDDQAARDAVVAPLRRESTSIDDDALALILKETQGYPYFLQEWASHSWKEAVESRIHLADVQRASIQSLCDLDAGFFRVRLDRLTPREKDYVRAMATFGSGSHRSGEIAQVLKMDVTAAGPLRSGLIRKGMVYSPQHGDTAFTVPMFDEFMCRTMPNWSPSALVPGSKKKRRKKRM